MARKFWGIPRAKRSLNVSITILEIIKDILIGRKWDRSFQEELDEFLVKNKLKRERIKLHDNPGNLRGNITNFKVFGLIYKDINDKFRLTKAGEELLSSQTSETIKSSLLRKQVLNLQYPSPYFQKGNSKIVNDYKIKPYRFIVELLLNTDLQRITQEEVARFLVFTENHDQLHQIENHIIDYRASNEKKVLNTYFETFKHRGIRLINGDLIDENIEKVAKKTGIDKSIVNDILLEEVKIEKKYCSSRSLANYKSREDIASTMKTHLTEIEIIKEKPKIFELKNRSEIKKILSDERFSQELIPFFEYPKGMSSKEKKLMNLNFYNKYGRGWDSTMGIQRNDLSGGNTFPDSIKNRVIKDQYDKLIKEKAIKSLEEAVEIINNNTYHNKKEIFEILKNEPSPTIDKFSNYFIEVGRNNSTWYEFEKANEILFKKLGYKAKHVGSQGREPDVLIWENDRSLGIVDSKATENAYSVSSGDERAMRDYIKKYSKFDIRFFLFSAGKTAKTSE